MSGSILNSVKKSLDLMEDDTTFDSVIMMHINSVFSELDQVGVGPSGGFMIEDATAQWDTILGGDKRLNMVKSYMYLKVRFLFDPPSTSFLLAAQREQANEYLWRINAYREHVNGPVISVLPPTEFILDGGDA